jgi:hypothetical protein
MRLGVIVGGLIVLGLALIMYMASSLKLSLPEQAKSVSPQPSLSDAYAPASLPQEKTALPKPAPSLSDTLSTAGVIQISGDAITKGEVESAYEKLPIEIKESTTKTDVLNGMIAEKMLIATAKKKGIVVTDQEISNFIDQFKKKSGMDDAAFEKALAGQGISIVAYRDNVKDMLAVSKLLNDELHLQDVGANGREVEEYVEKNKDQFAEFFQEENPALIATLKTRVQQKLTQEKREALIKGYIATLTADIS